MVKKLKAFYKKTMNPDFDKSQPKKSRKVKEVALVEVLNLLVYMQFCLILMPVSNGLVLLNYYFILLALLKSGLSENDSYKKMQSVESDTKASSNYWNIFKKI